MFTKMFALKIILIINLNFLLNGAHSKGLKDSKEQQKDPPQAADYNPLGALVR